MENDLVRILDLILGKPLASAEARAGRPSEGAAAG
jgi:hypothetical protein